MSINPQDAKPDQPYKVTLDGEWHVAVRNNPRQEHSEWRLIPKPGVQALWAGDGAVKNLTPLVPARNITRDDLPSEEDIQALAGKRVSHGESTWGLVLDAVVAHLNENGGIPAEARQSETHINVIAHAGNTLADFSEKLRKLSEEFKEKVQVHALRDAEGNIVEHVLTPRKFAAGGYVPSPEGGVPSEPFGISDKLPSCCEEAELTANDLARWKKKLAEAEEEIEAQKGHVEVLSAERDALQRCLDSWRVRAEKAEAERDEWKRTAANALQERDLSWRAEARLKAERDELQDKLDDPYSEVNQKAAAWDRVERHPLIGSLSELPEGDSYAERVGKRLDQLAEMESAITELEPAENHVVTGGKTPKWMHDEAERLVRLELGSVVSDVRGTAEKILALATAEGWPEWLGPKINLDDLKPERAGDTAFRVDKQVMTSVDSADEAREAAENYVRLAASFAAIARFIENEQTSNRRSSKQGVNDLAEEIRQSISSIEAGDPKIAEKLANDLIDAGWTPPENEDE